MDFKKEFKNKLKEQTKGLDIQKSSPLSLFDQINEEYNSEINRNPILKFKKTLSESKNEVTQNVSMSGLFDLLEQTKEEFQELNKEELSEVLIEEVFFENEEPSTKDLISLAMDSISKEESSKFTQEHTNLFSQPDSKKPDPNIKALQAKLKMLEDWVSKISMAGPGGGEVNFRYLDDVNSGSIGENKYLTYNQDNRKFYFDYITSNTIVNNTTVVTSNTYSLVSTDYYVGVNSPESTTIFLQTTAQDGKIIVIKDESGNCSINPISVVGNVDNDIGGFILKIDNGAVQMVYRNGWRII
jgi:hypothetical protein